MPLERVSDPPLVRSALPILLMGIIKCTPYRPILVNNNSVFLPILVFLMEVNVITTKMYIDMDIWPHQVVKLSKTGISTTIKHLK